MAASPSSEPESRGGIVITRGGVTRVFESQEDARAFAHQPMTEAEREQLLDALRMSEEVYEMVMARTGGKGISEEAIEDALRSAKDH